MAKFQEDDIELIWGYSKDHNLEEGSVKVTVLATGFGMKDIPGMEPVIKEEEKANEAITHAEQMQREKENRELEKMVGVFYKSEYKTYIFKGDEMYNEEFIEALDNSPTYKRSSMELEKIKDSMVMQATDSAVTEQVATGSVVESEAGEVEPTEENENYETEKIE